MNIQDNLPSHTLKVWDSMPDWRDEAPKSDFAPNIKPSWYEIRRKCQIVGSLSLGIGTVVGLTTFWATRSLNRIYLVPLTISSIILIMSGVGLLLKKPFKKDSRSFKVNYNPFNKVNDLKNEFTQRIAQFEQAKQRVCRTYCQNYSLSFRDVTYNHFNDFLNAITEYVHQSIKKDYELGVKNIDNFIRTILKKEEIPLNSETSGQTDDLFGYALHLHRQDPSKSAQKVTKEELLKDLEQLNLRTFSSLHGQLYYLIDKFDLKAEIKGKIELELQNIHSIDELDAYLGSPSKGFLRADQKLIIAHMNDEKCSHLLAHYFLENTPAIYQDLKLLHPLIRKNEQISKLLDTCFSINEFNEKYLEIEKRFKNKDSASSNKERVQRYCAEIDALNAEIQAKCNQILKEQ